MEEVIFQNHPRHLVFGCFSLGQCLLHCCHFEFGCPEPDASFQELRRHRRWPASKIDSDHGEERARGPIITGYLLNTYYNV